MAAHKGSIAKLHFWGVPAHTMSDFASSVTLESKEPCGQAQVVGLPLCLP